ncbi:thioredoxin reductase [Candidatus Saccharibacteria bacterium]|nr:MAG: thioredoxin reductase [Candidatus Saccharibacteria bacterium]
MAEPQKVYDLAIIGGGPAALSAAIYTTREDLSTVILEKGIPGGMIAVTDKVDNYPGFPDGVEGMKLADDLRQQAERFGTEIRPTEVTNIASEDGCTRLVTVDGDVVAKAVLIATGTEYKKLGIPGEEEFYARGVHYCATCDGAFYRDKRLVVVGGGNSAVQEALFLTRFASHIDLLVRSKLRASDVLQRELDKQVAAGSITVHLQTTTDRIEGEDGKVTTVQGTNTQSGERVSLSTDGVFVFIGLSPNTAFLRQVKQLQFDDVGFVVTDAGLQTAMPGVFAAGDVRSGATMQIATAVGEGATAALKIREYLESQQHGV